MYLITVMTTCNVLQLTSWTIYNLWHFQRGILQILFNWLDDNKVWGNVRKIIENESYLKQETNQSQESLGMAMNAQMITVNQATESIEILVLETFWPPRYKKWI